MPLRALFLLSCLGLLSACSTAPTGSDAKGADPGSAQSAEEPARPRSQTLDRTIAAELAPSGGTMSTSSTPLHAVGGMPVTAEAFFYTCLMHPQIHQDHAGACPICGMELVKKVLGDGAQKGTGQ